MITTVLLPPPLRRVAAHLGWAWLLAGTLVAPPGGGLPRAAAENSYLATERTVDGQTVRVGMSAPLSGLNAGNGQKMRTGIEVCFRQVNARGGVDGRRFELAAYDDHYEPLYTLVNTRRLLNDDHVFALCSFFGTPNVLAVLPMLDEARVPMVGSSSAADGLVQPPRKYFFSATPTYGQETELLVRELVGTAGCRRVAVFYQDDGFGETIVRGTERALRSRGLTVAVAASYLRSTTNVAAALETILAARPDAVILGATYPGAAAFARAAHRQLPDALLGTIGQLGSEDFVAAAGEAANGVYIAQPIPDPNDASLELVGRYQQAMREAGEKEFTYFTLLGYLHATLLVEGVRRAGSPPTTAAFVAAMDHLSTDLGGYLCAYEPGNHQCHQQVYLSRVEGGRIRAVDRIAAR